MQTSGLRSAVPPNQAATRPAFVSAMVEAWQEGKGAVSKMNSDFTIGLSLLMFVAQPNANKQRSKVKAQDSMMVPFPSPRPSPLGRGGNCIARLKAGLLFALIQHIVDSRAKRQRAGAVQD